MVFLLVGLSGALIYESSPWHAPDYTKTVALFLKTFANVSAWPLMPFPGATLVIWLPWMTLAVLVLAGKRPAVRTACGWLAFGIGLWVFGHVVGFSYARPELFLSTDSRYFTSLFTVIPVSLATVALLWQGKTKQPIRYAILMLALIGLVAAGRSGVRGLEAAQNHHDRQLVHMDLISRFVQTRDPAVMNAIDPVWSPFWNSNELAVRLEDEKLLAALPYQLRSVSIESSADSDEPPPNGPGPLTRITELAIRLGPMVASCGIVILLCASFLPGPRIAKQGPN